MAAKQKKDITVEFLKYIRWFWIIFSLGIICIILMFLSASWGLLGEMPDHTQLENPETNLATEIISSDNKTLGNFYFRDNRTPVNYDELPKHLVNALIATEDVRYLDHAGIDARSTLRAILKPGSGGASTITQQLAKLLFTKRASSNKIKRVIQKFKEWIIAIRLERQYTKQEIIAQYLNIVDFDNNADGIRSASRIYFGGKEPNELDIKESAMIVGMLKNPSLFNPLKDKGKRAVKTKKRRQVVFAQMAKYNFISEAEKDSLQGTDLGITYKPDSHSSGTATYFRTFLKKQLKKWIDDENNRKPDGSKYNINSDGLKIYTTIDSRMQKYAEKAVADHMPRLQAEFFHQNTPSRNPTAPFLELTKGAIDTLLLKGMRRGERWRVMKAAGASTQQIINAFNTPTKMRIFSWKGTIDTTMTPMDSMRYYKSFLRTGMMAMDPQTGYVKTWVGGINYKHFQYDMVSQGKRQIGSTFKPFVYAAAMDQLGYSPCDTFSDTPFCIEAGRHGNTEQWCPENSGGHTDYGGKRTLKNGIANSVNTITARLIDQIGPQPVIDLAHNLGIQQDILPVPSIALGTPDLSVHEMVAAYATFANKGIYTKPVIITRIEDKNGTTLFQFTPETKDVLSEQTAYLTVNLLEGVTQAGSGVRLRTTNSRKPVYKEIITGYPYNFTNPIAGKTGTTQNQSDGWFIGMVPNLVTGVWVGAEDRAAHFKTITYGSGASMALPIWALFMKSCYNDQNLNVSKEDFEKPKQLSVSVDCDQDNNEDSPSNFDDELEIDF